MIFSRGQLSGGRWSWTILARRWRWECQHVIAGNVYWPILGRKGLDPRKVRPPQYWVPSMAIGGWGMFGGWCSEGGNRRWQGIEELGWERNLLLRTCKADKPKVWSRQQLLRKWHDCAMMINEIIEVIKTGGCHKNIYTPTKVTDAIRMQYECYLRHACHTAMSQRSQSLLLPRHSCNSIASINNEDTYTHKHVCIYIYMYIYIYVSPRLPFPKGRSVLSA